MLARTRLKLKNAESSISFMQQQHARTLEDLHKEIERLQKKNARLSFQLTMTGVNVSSGGQMHLEEELISEVAQLQSSLSKEQENRALLQHQVDHLFTRHSEEISTRDDSISQLNCELDAKANIITLVTQQLCKARATLKKEIEARSKKPSAGLCVCPHCFVHRKTASTEGRLSPLKETQCTADAELAAQTTPTARTGKLLLIPSPPSAIPSISPHPLPRNRIIKRRASTPIRRQSPVPRSSLANLSVDSSVDVHHQKSLRPACAARVLSSELQELLGHPGGDMRPVRKETHPVLPPIPVPLGGGGGGSESGCVAEASLLHGHRGTHDHSSRRRLILAKGLSSAPSTLRVLHYGRTPTVQERGTSGGGEERGGGGGEEGEGAATVVPAPEGTLLLGPPQSLGTLD